MGGLFELIFENFFLFFIIVSAIIGFLSGDKEKQQKKEWRPAQPSPQRGNPPATRSRTARTSRQQPARSGEGFQRTIRPGEGMQEVYTSQLDPKERDVEDSTSIESEQQAQLKRLQERLGAVPDADVSPEMYRNLIAEQELTFSEVLKKIDHFSDEQRVLRNDLKKSLKNKGLINGIIMAEVLGKPRALKPYESVVVERYKR